MKFKVGDKVKVRKDLENGYFSITNLKQYQKNKVFTISRVFEDKTYFLLEDKRKWWFSEDMLIPVEEEKEEIILKGVKKHNAIYEMELPEENNYIWCDLRDDKIIIGFQEKEKEILDEIEKEYLRAVIKPFRDKVKYIKKNHSNTGEYITICVFGEFVNFPYFRKGKMYKNMINDKKYSLEELGL